MLLFYPEKAGKGIPFSNSHTPQLMPGDPVQGNQEATKVKEMEKIYANKKDKFDYLDSVAKDIRKYMKTLYRHIKFPSETEGMFDQPNFVCPDLKDSEGKYIYKSQAVKICDFLLNKLCK